MGGTWERLGAADRNYLALETDTAPMHMAALATLEGAPRLADARARLEPRARAQPALRRVLRRPGPPFGPPLWTDEPAFAIEHHILEARVAAPGGGDEVLRAVEDLVARRLDRSRPLWELWLLTGPAPGRAAVLLKLHHSIADGLAALEVLGRLFDPTPDVPDPPVRAAEVRPPPDRFELLADNAARKAAACRSLGAALAHPGRLLTGAGAMRRTFAESRGRPVRTSLQGPLGRGRRLAVVQVDLEEARAFAHRRGGTVNDVILTLAAAGLRDVLSHRGEQIRGQTLYASVAATVRPVGEVGALGNRVGGLVVPLPIGDVDAGDLLQALATATRRAKATQLPANTETLMVRVTSNRLARVWFRHQHVVQVFETDLPGPRTTLYLLGNRVLELVPITALAGNVTTTFAALSYAGRLAITVCVDAGRGADLGVLRSGMERTWDALRAGQAPPGPEDG